MVQCRHQYLYISFDFTHNTPKGIHPNICFHFESFTLSVDSRKRPPPSVALTFVFSKQLLAFLYLSACLKTTMTRREIVRWMIQTNERPTGSLGKNTHNTVSEAVISVTHLYYMGWLKHDMLWWMSSCQYECCQPPINKNESMFILVLLICTYKTIQKAHKSINIVIIRYYMVNE